jgi:hypothetical protein
MLNLKKEPNRAKNGDQIKRGKRFSPFLNLEIPKPKLLLHVLHENAFTLGSHCFSLASGLLSSLGSGFGCLSAGLALLLSLLSLLQSLLSLILQRFDFLSAGATA